MEPSWTEDVSYETVVSTLMANTEWKEFINSTLTPDDSFLFAEDELLKIISDAVKDYYS